MVRSCSAEPASGMEKTTSSGQIGVVDKLLVNIGSSPWDELYRVGIGFAIIPAISRLRAGSQSGWELLPFLVAVLVMLRVAPAVVRKLAPFSNRVLGIWARRRQIAKRYDSYQWQKLFWLGIGISSYTVYSGQWLPSRIIISALCLLAGAFGLLKWRAASSQPLVEAMRNDKCLNQH